jgi:transposase
MVNDPGIHTEKGVFLTHEEYKILIDQDNEKQARITYLEQELAQLKRMIFGSKSERFVQQDPGQLSLDLGTEQKERLEEETEELSFTRRKTNGKKEIPVRLPLPSHLHREVIVIEPREDVTGGKKIGEVVTEILEYTPGKFYVEKYVRPKYVLPGDKGIVIGDLPSLPIPRGNAGAGLLAHLMISKYVDHLPFYRQVQQFKRQDITVAESTINGWFTAVCRLLEPLYEKMTDKIKRSSYLMVDEVPIPVLSKDKPGSTHKGYHWVYRSPVDKLVVFDYQKGRGRDGPREFLKSFQGALQTDGYQAYDEFENKEGITLLACMAHVRRKFDQAMDNDPKRATYALGKIQQLYKIERKAREDNLSQEQRKELRQKEARPVMEELESWMKEQLTQVLPKSTIGEALAYSLKLWKRLIRYIDDGRWEIDNNGVENSIRPVALGRKNYMFSGSHEAARYAAMMYSFLGTCKINNVEPFSWLRDVLINIPDYSIQKLEELLPKTI